MKKLHITVALSLCALTSLPSASQAGSSASSHAPIGVMGDHLHRQGEFMMSYRYMRMNMEGNRVGDSRIAATDIVGTMQQSGQFMVAPTKMPMDMHMLGAMYGLSDNITLMGMVSYLDNSMDHLVRNGRRFSTASSGVGDTKVSALIRLSEGTHNMHFGVGVSLPTGSTTERDDTPAQANAVLPYPMQLGSGTYDFLPSFTYTGYQSAWSWGGQISAVIRTGENDEGYTLGNRFTGTAWLARDLNEKVSVSVRAIYQDWENIDGANAALNPLIVQTANTQLQSGTRLDAALGVNYLFESGHRLAFEYISPLDQDLSGPQLGVEASWQIGWQKAF